MSHPNDDQRDEPAAPREPARIREEGFPVDSLPTPEPLVPAEPLPANLSQALPPDESRFAPPDDASDRFAPPSDPQARTEPEWSWRSFGSRPGYPTAAEPIDGPSNEPESGTPGASADTTHGTLGEEPMGGLPREEPAAQRPADTAAAPGDSRQGPRSTLSRAGEELFAWLKTLASAAVYATLIVTFGFQVARVEGQSMAPTLAHEDRLIVNKLAYRIGSPQVGDIVMLYYPLNPDKSFVKRVIAEEGDQIRIVDGRVYRNDVPINDDYVPPEFRSHDDYGPEVVPQGYYFVMGDHRNNSSDSRHWKFVPKKYIIGKVQLRWWPIPSARIF